MNDLLKQFCQKMKDADVKPLIGLHQQGHFETVKRMRGEGKSWDEIGAVINWSGTAVEKWYGMEKE